MILGKNIDYFKVYDKNILERIYRKNKIPGKDLWNCYECTFIGENGIPKDYIGKLIYSSLSEYMVESKSLKLYLNSFDNLIIDKQEYEKNVSDILSDFLKTKVFFKLFEFDDYMPINLEFDDKKLNFKLDSFSNFKFQENNNIQHYKFSCFRSLCPVTKQKDTAIIQIKIVGDLIPTIKSMLEYIVSFRNHQAFHEHCIDEIYNEILIKCRPKDLLVMGSFLRRGGIDINPIRVFGDRFQDLDNFRLVRQ